MKMKIKHMMITAFTVLFCTVKADAQGQSLPILTMNTDARTAAMGNASVAAEGMFLYTNPAAFFTIDKQWTADVSASLFEKDEDIEGRYGLYAATVGYKLAKRHAVFAGFRYAGGLKLKGFDMLGNPTKDYKPYDWTIDMGYSYLIGNGFSAYAMGSFLFSHLSKNANGAAFTIGGAYQNNEINVLNCPAKLMIDAKVADFGPKLDYGNGYKTSMPTHITGGGALTVDVSDKHQIGVAASASYYCEVDNHSMTMAGAGAEYTYNKMLSVRAGYEYGNHDLSHFTVGVGIKYQGLRLNGSYMLGTTDAKNSYLTVGLGYDF